MERGEKQGGGDPADTRKILEDLAAARDYFLEASLTLQDALYKLDGTGRAQAVAQAQALLDRARQ